MKESKDQNHRSMRLLNDAPAGEEGLSKDAFNHTLCAGIVRDVLLDNPPGISVGLFARWGQGKSTVINLLKSKLGNTARLLTFNAYHARGDSVRRQMLLSILRQINSKKADEFERFTQTTMPLELEKAVVQKLYRGSALIGRFLFFKDFDWFLVISGAVAFITASAFAFILAKAYISDQPFSSVKDVLSLLATFVVSSIGFMARQVSKRKDAILAYTQPVSESQKLKYPEQFHKLFKSELGDFINTTKQRVIIVIDDIDRCEPGTVVEALASVRQFCHVNSDDQLNCQFLIPCDEGQLLSALEADGYIMTRTKSHYHNYSETEMLRKFFDVVVRMDEILPESLATYAGDMAKEIGADDRLAREMVDAAGISSPRKVKTLVNALKVAKEHVRRSQEANLLLKDADMEHLDNTLAVLVCFQELAPKAFAAVREDANKLDTDWLKQKKETDVEAVAHRIVTGLSPISIPTAEVLLTKQIEPSLRGCASAQELMSAERADDGERMLTALVNASQSERPCLIGWLGQKAREATTVARLRRLSHYVLDYGQTTKWSDKDVSSFFNVLPKKHDLLIEVLDGSPKIESWIAYCETIPRNRRSLYDKLVLANFQKQPDAHLCELRYLMHFANELDRECGNAFHAWIQGFLGEVSFTDSIYEQSRHFPRIERVVSNMPSESNRFYGFAPDVGLQIIGRFSSNTQIGAQLQQEILATLVLRLVGSDAAKAEDALVQLHANSPLFRNSQVITDSVLQQHGWALLKLVNGLLLQVPHLPRFSDLFGPGLSHWFQVQTDTRGRRLLFLCIAPGLHLLQHRDRQQLSSVIARTIVSDQNFSGIPVLEIDSHSKGWPSKDEWISFVDNLFGQFCNALHGYTNLPPGATTFISAVSKACWPVNQQADSLLAEKLRRLQQNSDGRPSDMEDWINAVGPLCDQGFPSLGEVVLSGLQNNHHVVETVDAALSTVWRDQIPDTHAAHLTEALIANGVLVFGDQTRSKQLTTRRGFDLVGKWFIDRLPSQRREWMRDNRVMLLQMSEFAALNDLAANFQQGVSQLLESPQDEFLRLGVQLLHPHKKLIADVRLPLDIWRKANSARKDELSGSVDELLTLPPSS